LTGCGNQWPKLSTAALPRSGTEIIVRKADFYAVYYKPTNQPQLILRRRSDTNDRQLLAQAWQAANDKARELGWIA
jgi:hypothetical protein